MHGSKDHETDRSGVADQLRIRRNNLYYDSRRAQVGNTRL